MGDPSGRPYRFSVERAIHVENITSFLCALCAFVVNYRFDVKAPPHLSKADSLRIMRSDLTVPSG